MPKISQLPQQSTPALTDKIPVVSGGITDYELISDMITTFFANAPTSGLRITGEIVPYGGRTAPSGWIICDGSAVSRTTFSSLFNIISPSVGTCTITNATPAVVTLTSHNLQTGDQVYLTTTGGLPTGLTINTLYYVIKIDANSFNLAISRANAYAAIKIATSSAGSGTHTLFDCPFGLGDGTTTFNVPDVRGRIIAGNDSMGGTVASRLTLQQTQGVYGNRGASGGEQGHQLITSELASHSHTEKFSSGALNGVTGIAQTANQSTAPGIDSTYTTANTGGDGTHNNVQPSILTNYLIKT